jgi:uncharacterized caspase-like protein
MTALVLLHSGVLHAQAGKSYAVLIGIDKYQDAAPVSFLNYADKDASLLNDHLKGSFGGRLQDVYTLTDFSTGNLQPTLTFIKRTLDQALQASERDDVYVFISARGQETYGLPEPYISAKDTQRAKPNTGLRVSELERFILQSRARSIFLFADVCREAQVDGFDNRINLRLADLRKLKRSVEVVLASEPRQASQEKESLKQGVFGFSLLTALSGQKVAAADVNQD